MGLCWIARFVTILEMLGRAAQSAAWSFGTTSLVVPSKAFAALRYSYPLGKVLRSNANAK